jgi:hypothetical protein
MRSSKQAACADSDYRTEDSNNANRDPRKKVASMIQIRLPYSWY